MLNKMTLKLVLILTLLPFAWLSAQANSIEELKNNPNYEIKIDADSVAVIYNKQTNLRWMKSIKAYTEPENVQEADLIIALDTLNLAYWQNLYRQWGWLDAANYVLDAEFIAVDANKNGKNEIYSFQITDTSSELQFSTVIFESLYDSLFAYVKTIDIDVAPVYDISDITGDELLDIVSPTYGAALRFYKQNNDTDYISNFNFVYDRFTPYNQSNDVTFYDLTGDGVQEIIYYLDAGSSDSVWAYSNHVAMYNPVINNYELIYYHRPIPNWFTFGFATGDFDSDGKNNFSTGSIDGNYFIYECVSGNNIQVEYQMQLETVNAFLSVMSEDMNGNGKNEIWVGSDFSSSVYGGVTRVFVLEPTGSGTYQVAYQIDIRGLFSGIYGRIRFVDVDGDGIKEIFLNNGTLVFCFKYSPQRDYYLDFIIDTWDYSSAYYEGTDVADLDSDGIPEFIMQQHLWPPYRTKSLFWKMDETVGVEDKNYISPVKFKLHQNYPNPFNPVTNIRFSIPQETKVNIKVYSVLGKEITQLINETRISGEYEISWNGTDNKGNDVPSGIYFISMKAGNFQKTIKSILIR